MAICVLAFMVWPHHFFTMGAGGNVNAFFGIMTMIIAVPTGVKVYNWLFTLFGGRIRFTSPVLWSLGFMVAFVLGGMTGVLMAVPPADFVLHNSLFLIAHFHNVIIGGVLFGAFAGYTYWFPKAFGFRLHEGWGKAAFDAAVGTARAARSPSAATRRPDLPALSGSPAKGGLCLRTVIFRGVRSSRRPGRPARRGVRGDHTSQGSDGPWIRRSKNVPAIGSTLGRSTFAWPSGCCSGGARRFRSVAAPWTC
jgi:hypothetical protein